MFSYEITLDIHVDFSYISLIENEKKMKKTSKKVKMTPEFCHSFWRSECENRNIECYHCNQFYAEPLKKYKKTCDIINKRNEKKND